jgi:hypothetical protein
MAQTLYASFDDPSLAEKAAGALLDYGVQQQDLSLVTNDACLRDRQTELADSESRGFRMPADWQAAAAGRNPSPAGYTPFQESGDARYTGAATVTDAVGYGGRDEMEEDEDLTVNTYCNQEIAAKSGLSTTTPADAGAGAAKGAGIGLGIGVLAGLASLFVPGVGLVFGGGALAGALAGTAAATAAGALAGGVTGFLKDQGMTEELASRYHGTVQQGGAILALTLPSGNVDEPTAMQIVTKYGAADVHIH